MAIMTQIAGAQTLGYQAKDVMKDLLGRLGKAIDSVKQDIKAIKTYILWQLKYPELDENFSKKVCETACFC